MRIHERIQYLHSVIRLLEVVTPIKETLNNTNKLSTMDLVVSFVVDHFKWEVRHDFPLCFLFSAIKLQRLL